MCVAKDGSGRPLIISRIEDDSNIVLFCHPSAQCPVEYPHYLQLSALMTPNLNSRLPGRRHSMGGEHRQALLPAICVTPEQCLNLLISQFFFFIYKMRVTILIHTFSDYPRQNDSSIL